MRYCDVCVNEEGICYVCGGAYPGAPDPIEGVSDTCPCACHPKLGNELRRWSKRKSSRMRWKKIPKAEDCGENARSLVGILTDNVNSAEELAQ